MKKIFISLMLVMCSFAVMAQNVSPFEFGIKGGYAYTNINTAKTAASDNFSGAIKGDASNGSLLGIYVRVGKEKWYFQPELNYISMKSDISSDVTDFNGEVKLHTLDVPLQVGYRLVKLPVFSIRAFAGPVASFTMSDKLKLTSVGEDFGSTIFDEDGDFNSVNWALRFGAGINVWKLNLDVAYQKGLNDVSDDFFNEADLVLVVLGFKLF